MNAVVANFCERWDVLRSVFGLSTGSLLLVAFNVLLEHFWGLNGFLLVGFQVFWELYFGVYLVWYFELVFYIRLWYFLLIF